MNASTAFPSQQKDRELVEKAARITPNELGKNRTLKLPSNMPLDYARIACENQCKYGTEIDNYGPKLLADRYSDPTHFVYELLQNAEDALNERRSQADYHHLPRAAKFKLFKNRLEFRHFGIPFAEKHVRAICDITRSSKDKNPGAIGHFGIGFKSVYAFTRRPEVHSGEESFVIESLVRPAAIPRKQTAEGETLFVLPFDHDQRLPDESHAIIARRLRELGPRTLLFLRCLNQIDWEIDGAGFGSYLRQARKEAEGVKRLTLAGEERGRRTIQEQWLVFSRKVTDKNGKSGCVEIAYQVRSRAKRQEEIRRVKDSPLFVYFATDLQTNLGFLVQGPFHLTQNRDNILREHKWNKFLGKEVGKLTADSLSKLKALGRLSVAALDALPLEREPFETDTGKIFLPVYDTVLQAMRKHALIPGIRKNFVSSSNGVLVRGRKLAELFKPGQLQLLLRSDEERYWISPDITDKKSTQRLHLYLQDAVGVDEFHAGTLLWRLDADFLEKQNQEWFVRFYRFLLNHQSLWAEDGILRQKPIIRLAHGNNVVPFGPDGANAFLPTNGEYGPKTVHPKCSKGDALNFLRKLGIRERDSVAEVIEDILPQYQRDEPPSEAKHLRNLRRILRALEDKESPDHKPLIEKLSEIPFLRARNAKSGKIEFKSPSSLIYFPGSELALYFEGASDAWFVQEPSVCKKDKDRAWLAELGVAESPSFLTGWDGQEEAKRQRGEKIQAGGKFQELEDFHLHGLDELLNRIRRLSRSQPVQAIRLAKTLWSFLCEALTDGASQYFEGRLQWKKYHHRRPEIETFDAWFVERLRAEPWLPDRQRRFRKPSDMHQRELPAGFDLNRTLCNALQFQTPRAEKLKQVGLTAKEIRLLELSQRNPQFADEFCRSWRKRDAAESTASAEPATTARPPENPRQAQPSEERNGSSSSAQPMRVEPAQDKLTTEIPPCPVPLNAEADPSAHLRQPDGDVSSRTDFLQTRIRVAPADDPLSTPETMEIAECRSRIDRAGIEHVKAYEKKAGRIVEELYHSHPGYDLLSKNKSGEVLRYIEVKSTGLDWTGVLLSAIQFREAQRLGKDYWLYVVESAESPNARIYPIQNPAGLAEKFIFDNGWKLISQALQQLADAPE